MNKGQKSRPGSRAVKREKGAPLIRERQVDYKVNRDAITLDKIEEVVERVVNRKFQELLGDPDYGLKLRKKFRDKLNAIMKQKKKIIPEEKILRKYRIEL